MLSSVFQLSAFLQPPHSYFSASPPPPHGDNQSQTISMSAQKPPPLGSPLSAFSFSAPFREKKRHPPPSPPPPGASRMNHSHRSSMRVGPSFNAHLQLSAFPPPLPPWGHLTMTYNDLETNERPHPLAPHRLRAGADSARHPSEGRVLPANALTGSGESRKGAA